MSKLIPLALLLLPLFAGCQCECKAGDMEPKKTGTTETPTAPAKSAAQPTPAKEGLVVCTKHENKACVDPTTQISPEVPEIFAVLFTRSLPKTPKAVMVWIAVDTGGAAPPNYKIATKEIDLGSVDLAKANHIIIDGSLTRPTKGWPLGKYRVEVHMDGNVAASQQFEIKKQGA